MWGVHEPRQLQGHGRLAWGSPGGGIGAGARRDTGRSSRMSSVSEVGLPVSDRDRPHFLRLTRDLWRDEGSRVSLMVGAGLSKHARPSPGASRPFPTGEELAEVMRTQLPSQRDFRSDRASGSPRVASSPATIATEYESVFGRPALEDLIRTQVPDDEYEPGPLHEALLRLPWRDVFTTNYDTLLERTCVPDRTYSTVMSENDLPSAVPPRIIKLHGSFDGESRLISTDDDYRTYRKDFPLFVNTVRQSLIENALVLVGFSGEDRNFLTWIGWIRDRLGVLHPPIYLIVRPGGKEPPPPLLKQRGVTPILLSDVPGISAIGQTTDHAALHHFVQGLSTTRPRAEKWSVEASGDTVDGPSSPNKGGDRSAEIERAIQRWRQERESYPGWLIAPTAERQRLWQTTKHWVDPVLKASEGWSATAAVEAISELNWRFEVAMVPLFSAWRKKIEAAVKRMTEMAGLRGNSSLGANESENGSAFTSSAEVARVRLLLALARDAREDCDETRWSECMETLAGSVDRFPDLVDRYHYESALWKLARIDRGGALEVLEKWEPARDALRARLWRAGLFAEVGELAVTRTTLLDVLSRIQRVSRGSGGQGVAFRSMEGWCAYLLFAVEVSLDLRKHEALKEQYGDLWRQLRDVDCDPWTVNDYFASVLDREPPEMPQNVRTRRTFDPGRRRVVRSLGGAGIGPWLPAFACLRWFEEVGIPVRGRMLAQMGRKPLVAACRWIAPFYSFRGISVLVRAGAVKELREEGLMDRPRVAEMDEGVATQLNDIMLSAAEREARTLSRDVRPWRDAGVLEAAVEVLSRVTVRLDGAGLENAFQGALGLYRELRSVPVHGLGKVVASWFERLYDAADDAALGHWFPALLRAPLREGDQEGAFDCWFDPLVGFPLYQLQEGGAANKKTLAKVRSGVKHLLARGQVGTGRQRKEVVWRLSAPFGMDLLTKAQREQFAALLWAEVEDGKLPHWEGLWVWDYAVLPSMGQRDLLERIKEDLLCRFPTGEVEAEGAVASMVIRNRDDRPWEAGAATKGVVEMPYEPKGVVEWTAGERDRLWGGLRAWWEKRRREMLIERRVPLFGEGERTRAQAADLERCLVRLKIATMDSGDATAWAEVRAFLKETREQGVELGGALPYLLIVCPREKGRVVVRLTEDLRCDDARRATAAARGVRHWTYLAEAERVDKIPDAVVDALVDRVAFRLLAGAQECIRNLAAVLVENGSVLSTAAAQRLVSSLDAWKRAVAPVVDDSEPTGIPQDERPDLRASVGVLANALTVWWATNRVGRKPPDAVQQLLRDYQADRLPEVRRAVSEGRWRYW